MRYDWYKIETEYVSGTMTMEALAERYGIANSTFFKRAKEREFVEKRRKFREKVEEKNLARRRARKSKKLERAKDEILDGFCAAAKRYKDYMTSADMFNSHVVSGKEGIKIVIMEAPDTKRVRDMAAMGKDLVTTYRDLTGNSMEEAEETGGVIVFAPREDIE